jgi:hypothetical protein
MVVMATKFGLMAAAGVGVVALGAELSGVLGLIPAAGFAGGTALAALALGTRGFGEAMKNLDDPEKFNEALAKLSPTARDTARAIRELAPAWREMQQGVQNFLFMEVADRLEGLSNRYLPMLGRTFNDVAGNINEALHGVIDLLMETGRQADLKLILDQSAQAVENLSRLFVPLVAIIIDLGVVGAPIFTDLTAKVAGLAERFAAFISNARQTGQLREWILTGLQAVKDLWVIMDLLIGTVINLVAALGGPDTLLGVLTLVAEALNKTSAFIRDNTAWLGPLAAAIGAVMAVWKLYNITVGIVTAVQGSAFLKMIAGGVAWVATATAQILTIVAKWLWLGVQATFHALKVAAAWLLTTGASAAAAVASTAATVLKIIGQWLLMAAQSALHAAKVAASWLLTTGAAAATAIAQTTVTVGRILAQWLLMAGQAALHGAKVAGAWLLTHGAQAAAAIAGTARAVGAILAQWALLAARSVLSAGRLAVAWLLTHGAAAAAAIAGIARTVGLMLVQWALLAAQSVARAVIAAGAWFIAMGPVGWVIAAIVGLVAIIVANWDRIVAAFKAGATWVMNILRALPGQIVSIFTGAMNWLISAGANLVAGLWNGWNSAWAGFWNTVAGIVRAIFNFFAPSYQWLLSAGKNLLIGLWNGIASMGGWLWDQVQRWANSVISGIKSFFGLGSPSRITAQYGEWLVEGLGNGIDANDSAVRSATTMAKTVLGAVNDTLADGSNLTAGISTSLTPGGAAALTSRTPALAAGGAASAAALASAADRQARTALAASTSGSGTHIELNTFNPIAEKASDTEARKLRAAAAAGGL